jgi:hypothetical protein
VRHTLRDDTRTNTDYLVDNQLLDDLRTTWQWLEEAVAAAGGKITLGEKGNC